MDNTPSAIKFRVTDDTKLIMAKKITGEKSLHFWVTYEWVP